MKLFHVQDSDRPMYVLGEDYGQAVKYWKERVASENECAPEEVEEPEGVHHLADAEDIIMRSNMPTLAEHLEEG